ncbi:hypothetical protein P8C59_002805 [Phyllachora maydis]|uniref:Uncharacterized protein n=2 Tax=Phyllachora maydis TaxID=1825666 RepID=A0AAD9M8E1_9PEZI|nr:hypothetical protein P8C59_002805 [Phyllachora maydis]
MLHGELVDDSDDDTDSDFVWEDDDNPFANDGDPFSDSIFENLDDGPDDPPDLSFDVEGCGRHLDAAYLNRTLFSTTYDILAKVALSDPVRYPMFSDLKILNYMVSWDYCRAFVRRYRHRTTQTFRAAARRFKAECGKALAIRATGTVYWLAESNIAPPHGNTGLEASMGLERSRFAKYEFPLLCRNQHVTTFYRVNRRMLDDDDMTEVERQDITELVMAMRREGTCPPVQMTGDPFPQTLTGEPMDDED